jgi:penicillin-binding protein 1A
MAQAFAAFANQGREVTPIAIRSIEDRNGRTIMDLERNIRHEQRRRGNAAQLISPQTAYVMTSMLMKTLETGPNGHGTLYNPSGWGTKFNFRDRNGETFRMPMAGKTGTTQNWADAWTVGYSPYITTAIWFGFDRPGNSLGVNLTGSTLAGPVWADYMREIHQGLPFRDFLRPSTGLIDVTVCARSGLLKTSACNSGEFTLTLLEGTQPLLFCEDHGGRGGLDSFRSIGIDVMFLDASNILNSLSMPVLPDESVLSPRQTNPSPRGRTPPRSTPSRPATSAAAATAAISDEAFEAFEAFDLEPRENFEASFEDELEPPSFNPLLD